MKKLIHFVIMTAFVLNAAESLAAATYLNEWRFEDPEGLTLSQAFNSGLDGAVFSSDINGVTRTDGSNHMICSNDVAGTGGLWTDGAVLRADVGNQSSGVRFLRYDFEYDLTAVGNDSGTLLELAFADTTSTNLAGIYLKYDSAATPPTGLEYIPVVTNYALTGQITAIAKVDLDLQTIDVWYDLAGSSSFSPDPNSPDASASIDLTTIEELQFKATGDLIASPSNDCIRIDNIRTTASWNEIVDPVRIERYLNEWQFEDREGLTLSQAVNTGTDGAVFSADTNGVTRTDGDDYLICSNDVAGVGNLWTDGAVLRADVTNQSSGLRFLRYDFEYDLTAVGNDSGTLLELAFADTSATNLAGVYLKYDSDTTPPAGVEYVPVVTNAALTGHITAIAKVDLDLQTIDVWYDLTGDSSYTPDPDHSDASASINLTTIEELQFKATGDLIASPSNDCVRIDNIRTAATWNEITAPLDALEFPVLTGSISSDLGGAMGVGQTNGIEVTILNTGSVASNVVPVLSYSENNGGLSILRGSIVPITLTNGESAVYFYDVVANANGEYVLTLQVFADGITNSPVTMDLVVGPSVSDTELTLQVAPGQIASASVELSNDGTVGAPFVVSINDQLPLYYAVDPVSISRRSFWASDPVFEDWTETDSDPLAIGFIFTLHGIAYTSFSASQYGFLTLSNADGDAAELSVFETGGAVAQNTIRYDYVGDDILLVAWGNGTGKEFQLRLHSDGTFEYLYELGSWGDGKIGLTADLTSGDTVSQTFDHVPGQVGMDAISMSAETWVSFSPSSGTLDGYSSTRQLTFTADATSILEPATYEFSATVDWGGISNQIRVTVQVETNRYGLSVPSSFSFSGPAGAVSPSATLPVTNTGNVPVFYSIVDNGLQSASYTSASADYQWIHIPETASTTLDESDLGVEPVEIGFPFALFGTTYTNVTVTTDGILMFGDHAAAVAPFTCGQYWDDAGYMDNGRLSGYNDGINYRETEYSPWDYVNNEGQVLTAPSSTFKEISGTALSVDTDASVRVLRDAGRTWLAVTWENMAQPGGGEDQTFQTVLYRDGSIRFNYQYLGGGWINGAVGVSGNDVVSETLINDDTIESIEEIPVVETTYVTNTIGNVTKVTTIETVVGTNTVITYADFASRQSLEFTPGQSRIITCSPIWGTIPVGQTAAITLKGNATSLTSGETFNTDLLFIHQGGSESVNVTFTATGSVASGAALQAVAASTWGADDPVVSFELNPDGSRTLSWPAADDNESRVYSVWYTTALINDWILLGTVTNGTGYLDEEHMDEPVIFYKATVVWQ